MYVLSRTKAYYHSAPLHSISLRPFLILSSRVTQVIKAESFQSSNRVLPVFILSAKPSVTPPPHTATLFLIPGKEENCMQCYHSFNLCAITILSTFSPRHAHTAFSLSLWQTCILSNT